MASLTLYIFITAESGNSNTRKGYPIIHINEVSVIVPVQEEETEKINFIILQKIWNGYHATWKRRRAEWRGCKPDSWPCFELPGELLRFPPKQGPASTRYSTRTRNFLSYSNLTRTKHYSDRVVSSINSGNFNNYSEAARRYFRIITANPDIQMQPSMEKMSSDLNVKKMEDVSKLYIVQVVF